MEAFNLREKLRLYRMEWKTLQIGYNNALKQKNEHAQQSIELVETCKYSSMMVLNLINDLLDLAKYENQTFQLHKKYFDLASTVENSFRSI